MFKKINIKNTHKIRVKLLQCENSKTLNHLLPIPFFPDKRNLKFLVRSEACNSEGLSQTDDAVTRNTRRATILARNLPPVLTNSEGRLKTANLMNSVALDLERVGIVNIGIMVLITVNEILAPAQESFCGRPLILPSMPSR